MKDRRKCIGDSPDTPSLCYSFPMLSPERIRDAISEICATLPIRLAYLHGSYARGRADSDSDLDIALLAERSATPDARQKLRLDLQVAILREIGVVCPDLDVIILQDVPVLLQFNAVRKGILLYEKEPGDHVAYALRTEQAYDDEAPALQREADATFARILSHAQ